MKRVKQLSFLSDLFSFKTINDEKGNEYVVFENSISNDVQNIQDKTSFEAFSTGDGSVCWQNRPLRAPLRSIKVRKILLDIIIITTFTEERKRDMYFFFSGKH